MPIVYDYDARICANNPQGHGNCRVCCLLLAAVSRKTSSGVRRLFLTHARHRVTDSADLSFNLGEPAFLWIQDVLLILPCTFISSSYHGLNRKVPFRWSLILGNAP